MLGRGVEFVIVTHRATNSKSHKCGAECFRSLASNVDPQLLCDGATFVAADPQAHVPAANQWIESLHGQQIAGDLLHGKLVEALVVLK